MITDTTTDVASQMPDRNADVVCIRCGGVACVGRLWCPQCSGEKPPAAPRPAMVEPVSVNQFSITTLLLVTTLIAICLGVCVANPWLGISLSVLSAAALARTVWTGRIHLGQGLAFDLPEKVGWFVISLGVILGAVFAGIVVFIAVAGFGSIVARMLFEFGPPRTPAEQIGFRLLAVTFGIGVVVAPLATGIWLLWHTRPR